MPSASKLMRAGRRAGALAQARLRTHLSSRASSSSTPLTVARGFSVLESKTDKHLLSEFVGVRGPVAEEVGIDFELEVHMITTIRSTSQVKPAADCSCW